MIYHDVTVTFEIFINMYTCDEVILLHCPIFQACAMKQDLFQLQIGADENWNPTKIVQVYLYI